MSKRVMIVDDSPITSRQLKNLFEENGYTVYKTASNGMDAVKIHEENHDQIDFITLDITMPTMSGTQVLDYILQKDPQAKVIMVSAIGKENVIKECLAKGARHFITKPFQKDKVLEIARRLN